MGSGAVRLHLAVVRFSVGRNSSVAGLFLIGRLHATDLRDTTQRRFLRLLIV